MNKEQIALLRAKCVEIAASIDANNIEAMNAALLELDPLFGIRFGLANETSGEPSKNVLLNRGASHRILAALNDQSHSPIMEIWALRDFAFSPSPVKILTEQFNQQAGQGGQNG